MCTIFYFSLCEHFLKTVVISDGNNLGDNYICDLKDWIVIILICLRCHNADMN